MNQVATDTASVPELPDRQPEDRQVEDRLWTEYTVLLARKQACFALARHAWGAHVRAHESARDRITWRVYERCCDLHDLWRDRTEAAYAAWKKVAYPLYGWTAV